MQEQNDLLRNVLLAWILPGPNAGVHYAAQARLRQEWPVLAKSLDEATAVLEDGVEKDKLIARLEQEVSALRAEVQRLSCNNSLVD